MSKLRCMTPLKLESQFNPIIQLYQEKDENTPLEVEIMHVDGTISQTPKCA
ncbi:hypothetical protein NHP190002_05710 [Helicobacter ailurogastricus]|nr:hypothetical protein NHP190002_05710 [Helicobacter ailurogastricus]